MLVKGGEPDSASGVQHPYKGTVQIDSHAEGRLKEKDVLSLRQSTRTTPSANEDKLTKKHREKREIPGYSVAA